MKKPIFLITLMVLAITSLKVQSASFIDKHSWGFHPSAVSRCSNGLVGDCIGEDNEMLLYSETGRRILAGNGRFIGYGALRANNVPCGQRGNSYYNCQNRKAVNPYRRGCNAITRCARSTG